MTNETYKQTCAKLKAYFESLAVTEGLLFKLKAQNDRKRLLQDMLQDDYTDAASVKEQLIKTNEEIMKVKENLSFLNTMYGVAAYHFSMLSEREQGIITAHIRYKKTFTAIGIPIYLCKSRVHEIFKAAVMRLSGVIL